MIGDLFFKNQTTSWKGESAMKSKKSNLQGRWFAFCLWGLFYQHIHWYEFKHWAERNDARGKFKHLETGDLAQGFLRGVRGWLTNFICEKFPAIVLLGLVLLVVMTIGEALINF
jgi:hypothetical protein